MSHTAPQPYTPDELDSLFVPLSESFVPMGALARDTEWEPRLKATAEYIRDLEEKVTASHAVIAGLQKSSAQVRTWFEESQAQVRDLEAQVQRYEAPDPFSNEMKALIEELWREGDINWHHRLHTTLQQFLTNRRSKPNEN